MIPSAFLTSQGRKCNLHIMRRILPPVTAGVFLCFFLSSCNSVPPDKEINGSVFIVTKGAGAYKLALVKVYFCPVAETKDDVAKLQQAYSDQVDAAKNRCDQIKKSFDSLLADRDTAHANFLRQVQDDNDVRERYNKIRSQVADI